MFSHVVGIFLQCVWQRNCLGYGMVMFRYEHHLVMIIKRLRVVVEEVSGEVKTKTKHKIKRIMNCDMRQTVVFHQNQPSFIQFIL